MNFIEKVNERIIRFFVNLGKLLFYFKLNDKIK